MPKEHGAYGQLLFPLATALLIGRRTPAALALAGAVVITFLLHERVLLIIGERRLLTGVKHLEHTLAGEIVAALILASASWPVARAAGVSIFAANACTIAFGTAFTVATVSVRAVIAATRRPPAIAHRAAVFLVAAGLWLVLWWSARAGTVSIAAAWASFPMCVTGCVLAAMPPSARRLRVVGWTLVAMTGLAVLMLVAVLG